MVRVRGYRVIIRPAMFVLVGACITGAIAIPTMQQMPERVRTTPIKGYLYPERWKFETRHGAEATITGCGGRPLQAMKSGADAGFFQINMEEGVEVQVKKTAGAETVYLRNGFNLAEMKEPANLVLRFEACSESNFPLLLTARVGRNMVWHQNMTVQGAWKAREIILPIDALRNRDGTMLVFAVQLGEQNGTVGLRHVTLTEQGKAG